MNLSISLYELLKDALGEQKAKEAVDIIDIKIETQAKEQVSGLAKAQQIQDLDLKTERSLNEIKVLLAEQKADLLKWMITIYMAGFLAMTGAIIGLYFK